MLRLVAALVLGSSLGSGPSGSSVEFAFTDPAIVESSGLVVDESTGQSLFVTTNDSGDTGRVFTVDPRSGASVGVTTWSSDPVDVEALAPAGPGEVWVADIGDNDAQRASVSVVRVPVGRGEVAVEPRSYDLVYPRGAGGGPRDAETLLVDPDGRLLVVSKELLGGEFFRVDEPLVATRPNQLTPAGAALPFATDGAFFPDGRHLVVRGYGLATVYAYPSLEEVGSFALPDQEQGEGIAVDDSGAVFVSSEGVSSQVLRVELPRRLRRAIAAPVLEAGETGQAAEPGDGAGSAAGSSTPPGAESATGAGRWGWAVGAAVVLVLLGSAVARVRSLRPRG